MCRHGSEFGNGRRAGRRSDEQKIPMVMTGQPSPSNLPPTEIGVPIEGGDWLTSHLLWENMA